MRLVFIPNSRTNNSIDVQLEHANMVFNPRFYGLDWRSYKFSFSVKGRILTITRIDKDGGWDNGFYLCAYLPTEHIPDFTSTVYTYWGLHHEKAPKDTTEVIFAPSLTTIKEYAFDGCKFLVRITMPDTISRIKGSAFSDCDSLRFIRLSINLEFIGYGAFRDCKSVEAVFLPPTITQIADMAFCGCTSLRFCILPDPIEHIGHEVFQGCDCLSTTVSNNLSKVCSSTSVNSQSIQECIDTHGIERAMEVNDQQLTALHILCANPHVTSDCIRAYLQLAPEAAEQQASDGMTSFQYLCRNDIAFLEDRSFSSFMAWWYCCMPPLMETGKKRKRG